MNNYQVKQLGKLTDGLIDLTIGLARLKKELEREGEEESKERWADVTKDCLTTLRKSKSSDGYYIALCYHGRIITVFGVGRFCYPNKVAETFRIVKAKDATVSFRVYHRVS